MKEKYEGVEYVIFPWGDTGDKFVYDILVYNNYTCENESYHESPEWYPTINKTKEAAVNYITNKMQNGER
jgi:hypothetical protein